MNIFKSQLKITIALLLLNVSWAKAEDVDCLIIKDAIAASEKNFADFRGARKDLPPDPELTMLQNNTSFNYTRDEYATEHRIAPAANCSVIVTRAEDPDFIISEARFQCFWPSFKKTEAQFGAIKRALQACAITAQVEEDDNDNFSLIIGQVETGEGWSSVSVAAERLSVDINSAISVSVIHAICQAKTQNACDATD
jgi:hypothetical protein